MTKAARISKRPKSMPALKVHFAESGRVEKFPVGPMISPRPGPTFEIDVMAPESAVMKSRPIADRINASAMKQIA